MLLRRIRGFVLLTIVWLVGCQNIPYVPYSESGRLNVQQGWPYKDLYWQQHAILRVADSQQELLLTSYFRQSESVIVGLSLTGQELFRVSWHGHEFEVTSNENFPDPNLPWRVIGDLQLALWPIKLLESQLKGLTLRQQVEPNWQRTLLDSSGREVLVIRAVKEPLIADTIYIEHEFYQITIRSIEQEIMESQHE